jgi:hypothetical protein
MEREVEGKPDCGFGTETTDQAEFAYFISCSQLFQVGLAAGKDWPLKAVRRCPLLRNSVVTVLPSKEGTPFRELADAVCDWARLAVSPRTFDD